MPLVAAEQREVAHSSLVDAYLQCIIIKKYLATCVLNFNIRIRKLYIYNFGFVVLVADFYMDITS